MVLAHQAYMLERAFTTTDGMRVDECLYVNKRSIESVHHIK